MPITRNSFEIANDPSGLLLAFLSKNSSHAYSLTEIYENITNLSELGIPSKKIEDTLNRLSTWELVEVTVLKNDIYYIFNNDKDESDIQEYLKSHYY